MLNKLKSLTRRQLLLGGAALLTVTLLGVGTWLGVRWYMEPDSAPQFTYAPDFTLTDMRGAPVSLHESEGAVRVLNVWASWSPYSRTELFTVRELADENADVVFLALCRDVNTWDARAFLRELGLPEEDKVRYVLDPNDSYFKLIQGYNMPETLVLGKQNEILYHVRGPFDRTMLVAAIEQAKRGEAYVPQASQ